MDVAVWKCVILTIRFFEVFHNIAYTKIISIALSRFQQCKSDFKEAKL